MIEGDKMDGTWSPPKHLVKYVVCPSCNELVKKEEIVKNGYKCCWRCAEA